MTNFQNMSRRAVIATALLTTPIAAQNLTTFVNGEVADANAVNANFEQLRSAISSAESAATNAANNATAALNAANAAQALTGALSVTSAELQLDRRLQFAPNSTANRKVVLWGDNDNQFYGFGVNNGILRYQVTQANATTAHVFYAGLNTTNSAELMRITGEGRVGMGTDTPATRLHVRQNAVDAALPEGHSALIQDTSATTTSILALQSSYNGQHSGIDNFITFFDSNNISIGSIEGNGTGSVQLSGAGSDYAEYLPFASAGMRAQAAQIVGVKNGHIVAHGEPAERFMVVTAQAIVAGNRPSEDQESLSKRALVSFIGQVPVQVRGSVASGDYIVAGDDGVGIPFAADELPVASLHRVVGRAWEDQPAAGLKNVNTAVGLDQTSIVVPALERIANENRTLRATNEELRGAIDELAARLTALESQNR